MNKLIEKLKEYEILLQYRNILQQKILENQNKEILKSLIDKKDVEKALIFQKNIHDDSLQKELENFIIIETDRSVQFKNTEKLKRIIKSIEKDTHLYLVVKGKIISYVYESIKNLDLYDYMKNIQFYCLEFKFIDTFESFFSNIIDEKINEYCAIKGFKNALDVDKWLEKGLKCYKLKFRQMDCFLKKYYEMEILYLKKVVDEGFYQKDSLYIKNRILNRAKRIGKYELVKKFEELFEKLDVKFNIIVNEKKF